MSSKQQIKEYLKGDKKFISELRAEIFKKDRHIEYLTDDIKILKERLKDIAKNYKPKKWYQF